MVTTTTSLAAPVKEWLKENSCSQLKGHWPQEGNCNKPSQDWFHCTKDKCTTHEKEKKRLGYWPRERGLTPEPVEQPTKEINGLTWPIESCDNPEWHWSFCTKDECPTHMSSKEGSGYWPKEKRIKQKQAEEHKIAVVRVPEPEELQNMSATVIQNRRLGGQCWKCR